MDLASALFLYSLLYGVAGQDTDVPRRLASFLDAQEQLVREVAQQASELHGQRQDLVRNCSCSAYLCSKQGPRTQIAGRRTLVSVTVPPSTEIDYLEAELAESLCVYENADAFVSDIRGRRDGPIYIGTHDGHARIYTENRTTTPSLRNCTGYDPRYQRWYLAATTVPKDVVFLVEKDQASSVLVNGAAGLLDTLSLNDFVNVVAFSDEAETLWQDSNLARATSSNIAALKRRLSMARRGTCSNYEAAFEEAFRLLSGRCRRADSCSGCRKVILLLTDGFTIKPNCTDTDVFSLLFAIDDLQTDLEEKANERASIFAFNYLSYFSPLAGLVSCSNDGIWTFVRRWQMPRQQGRALSAALAPNGRVQSPVWTEPDTTLRGEDVVATVSIPFYEDLEAGTSVVPLGVVAHEITVEEIEELGVSSEQLFSALSARSQDCSDSQKRDCEMQMFRDTFTDAHCANAFPTNRPAAFENATLGCYQLGDSFYKSFAEEVNWTTAAFSCVEDGGELASFENIIERLTYRPGPAGFVSDPLVTRTAQIDPWERSFVSHLAAENGSWVGFCFVHSVQSQVVRRTVSLDWIRATSNTRGFSDRPTGVLDRLSTSDDHEQQCLIVRRQGEMQIVPSAEEFHPYICEYESKDRCQNGSEQIPPEVQFDVPQPQRCPERRILALKEREPLQRSFRLNSLDIICSPEANGSHPNTEPLPLVLLGTLLALLAYVF